uniref:F-box domain-containing protein n=1 Tax=Mucochytrium quahogii TaxID=96639 RepID=A0A7S2WT13_9STRA|mmetsp:Transcript_19223/g.31547  ORF Transcript_19223/g.31547 Transcript_19223/m.31547 type:complete len:534 (-) Transcript_19223:813-2414(-)|eukprot:CAMPEP_0203745326 /NCGR_PEP_ID=MMETSP0098-20131031/1099_1 /ASSEMBLY_ACC=CAM_ASM_000208 /TAXON_ID=96639 /ORGANISM=" , Strain NY0313808BC1" /LENGTH=533 /DNA_ID=CAMNT_0050633069 /DNA_START=140 /DNA_END=1741 /DNA_ORIENTATION=+
MLLIVKATYGPADAESKCPEVLRFVTSQLKEILARAGGEVLVVEDTFNGLFGDPAPDVTKLLTIYYIARGVPGVSITPEGSKVFIDARTYDDQAKDSVPHERSARLARYKSRPESSYVFDSSDLVRLILSFLPLYPDRIASATVCRSWYDIICNDGLTDTFSVGMRGDGRPCYLGMPTSFFKMVFQRSVNRLVELNLAGYDKLSDDLVLLAIRGSPMLRTLDLSECIELTDRSLAEIGPCCPQLEVILLKKLSNMTDRSAISLVKNCRKLRSLNVSDCFLLTDESILEIARAKLQLRIFHAKDLYRVSDGAVRAVLASCSSSLEVLSLWSIHKLSKEGLGPMCGTESGPGMPKLASLNLWECYNLDDAAICSTVCSCSSLINLNLRNCHLITDYSIVTVATKLRRLEHLDIRYLRSITDKSLLAIAENLVLLRSINLTHCVQITQVGLEELCRSLGQLTELSVGYCPSFTNSTVQVIASAVKSRPEKTYSLDLLDLRGNTAVTSNARDILSTTLARDFKESRNKLFTYNPVIG